MAMDAVNVGVDADETRHSIRYYEEAVAQVLEELRNRGATNSLKRIRKYDNLELTAPEDGLATGTGISERLIVERKDLPKEILYNIFVRLSVPGIIRLGGLSKEWRPQVACDFQQECDQARPKMFALISKKQQANHHSFWVKVFDLRFHCWHAFEIPGGSSLRTQGRSLEAKTITAASEDGGLVCFVSTFEAPSKEYPTGRIFRVTVTNPLTKLEKKLPFMRQMSMVYMVKITTDAQTQSYKVLLFGVDRAGGYRARVYDPAISPGKWSGTARAPHGTTLEYANYWGDFRCSFNRDCPTVYNHSAAAGSHAQFVSLFHSCPFRDSYRQMRVVCAPPTHTKHFCLHKDRMFVLNKDSLGPGNPGQSRKRYYIAEYSIELQLPFTWVLVTSHRCEPFENPPQALYRMTLHACQGFLLVFADLRDREAAYCHVIGWLYDLTTLEWRKLPKPPEAAGALRPCDDLMCTLRWNIHP